MPSRLPPVQPAQSVFDEGLPRLTGNPYILPGHRQGQHLSNIDISWQRIRATAGVPDVRIHDLRRTVGSWLAQSGNSLYLIGKVLNHSDTSTTKVYARFGQDQVRDALEQHATQIVNAAREQTADVVDLNRSKA